MQDHELRALRDKYPLPDGVEDPPLGLNRVQLAAALQVSENTITKWIAQVESPMPVDVQGGNGKEYRFRLSDCYAWRMARDEAERAEKAVGDRAAAQLAMHFRNLDGDDAEDATVLTARQIKEESEADFRRNQAAELRGDLVRAGRVRELFEDALGEFRTTIVTVADFCEMEFGLSPEQVHILQARCDGALDQARLALTRVVGQGRGEVVSLAGPEQSEIGL